MVHRRLGASPEADLQNSRNRLSAFDSFHRASQIGDLSRITYEAADPLRFTFTRSRTV
jgi:hypothetical protein